MQGGAAWLTSKENSERVIAVILGYVSNADKEAVVKLPALQKGLQYLRDTDFSALENGKYSIDGDNMFAIISEYVPDVKENRKAETHNKYIDIQYIAAGEEIMGFADLANGTEKPEGYLADKDATFYAAVKEEIAITVRQGMFAVFFPWDIHRPGCVSQPGVTVRKVVVKIKLDQLQ